MRQWTAVAVLTASLLFSGCGDSVSDAVEEATDKDDVKFSKLDSTYMEIAELNATDDTLTEIRFCENGKSDFGDLDNGTFDIASAPTVNMDFSDDGDGTQQITETTVDDEFKVDEHITVDTNNSGTPVDYVIKKISLTVCL